MYGKKPSIFAAVFVFLVLCPVMGVPAFLAMPLAAMCLFGPWIVVRFMKMSYQRRFEVQLADTLMMMANGLRAGFSFLQAMEMVSRESQPPISDEFQRMTQEISVGVPVNQALENMSARVRSNDLDLMVTAVLIQREVGSSLAEVLEIIARVIGERLRIRGEIRTLTSQGRLTGMILGFLPMSLGIVLHLVGKVMTPGEPSLTHLPLSPRLAGTLAPPTARRSGRALPCVRFLPPGGTPRLYGRQDARRYARTGAPTSSLA